jgi:ribosomal RNA-processing protein 1
MLFVKVYFKTIIREWIGIDKWRIDKFMMMIRSMLKQTFSYICSKKWNKDLIEEFNKILLEYPLNINEDSFPDGEKILNIRITRFVFRLTFLKKVIIIIQEDRE